MARRSVELKGILPAMVTPMDARGEVDVQGLAALSDRLVKAGVGGLLPNGSTGEFTSLSNAERRLVTETVVAAANGRVPVTPHVGAMTAREAIGLAQHAQAVGAAAIMAIAPYYEPLTWRETKAYFAAVAGSVDIPTIIYDLPGATGMHMTVDQLGELADIVGIDYVKDSTADLVGLTERIQRLGDRIGIMNGWDTITFYGFAAGTPAAIWGAANFIPELCVELFDVVRDGDLARGREIWSRVWPICDFLASSGSYAAAVKAGCALVGSSAGDPREPVLPLEDSGKAQLANLLAAAGLRVVAHV